MTFQSHFVTQQNMENIKGCEYFLKALYFQCKNPNDAPGYSYISLCYIKEIDTLCSDFCGSLFVTLVVNGTVCIGKCVFAISQLSRPDLRETFYVSIWFGQGVIWVGILCSVVFYVFVFLCFGQVWFSIRDSCLSLSLIGNHT
jgi:hypothetical protein